MLEPGTPDVCGGPEAARHEIWRLHRLRSVSSCTARVILRTTSRDELLTEACRVAVDHGLFRMAWVGTVDHESGTVHPVAMSGYVAGYLDDIRISVDAGASDGQGPVGSALREGRPFVCLDIERDPSMAPWREAALARGYRSLACFPLRVRNAVVGSYAVYASEPGWFGRDEVQLLQALTSEISFALEVLERERDREQAELAARRERALTEAIFDTMPGILFMLDDEGKVVRWNRRSESVLGYAMDDLTGRSAVDLCTEEHRPRIADAIRRTLVDGRAETDVDILAKSGRPVTFFCTAVRVVIEGRPYVTGIGIDITDRRHADETHRSTEWLLRAIVESTDDAIFSRTLEGRILSWNDGAARLYGYRVDEVLSQRGIPGFVPEDRVDELAAILERAGRGESIAPFETQRRRKDGTIVDVSLRVSPLKDSRGRIIGACGIARDITEQKRAGAQMQRLRDELESQRLMTFRATMRTVQDIVNNFLMNLQLIRLEADGRLRVESLSLFDDLVHGTAAELKALGDLETISEKAMAAGTGIDYRHHGE